MTVDFKPPSRTFSATFEDADEYASAVYRGTGRILGAVPDRFLGRVERIELGDIKLAWSAASVPLLIQGGAPQYVTFMLAERAVPSRVLSGRAMSSNVLFHARPNDPVLAPPPHVSPWPWTSVGIAYEVLEHAAAALAGRDVAPLRQDAALIAPPGQTGPQLARVALDALGLISTRPEVFPYAPAAALALAGTITRCWRSPACVLQPACRGTR